MEDFSAMPAHEMLARRNAVRDEIAGLIGQFVFSYSRFVTGLHLCVAWHNDGDALDSYPAVAGDLAVADVLNRIEKQVAIKIASESCAAENYASWLVRAHQVRRTRNAIMHSRWNMEAYGRHAIATSTPILVEPATELIFTAQQLRQCCQDCEELSDELGRLRANHPL